MDHTDTRESLLDAAESLFSEHGIQAASLRQITHLAGANLAAVNYHFGSKEGLVKAVFARRMRPVSDERLRLLEQCDLEAPDALEQVLTAFLTPVLRMLSEAPDGFRGFGRLMGRAFSEPSEDIRQMVLEEFKESIERYMQAFGKLLPHLAEGELMWRFHFVAGAMVHTLGCAYTLERFAEGKCHATDPKEALEQLVAFLSAGMRGPSRAKAN